MAGSEPHTLTLEIYGLASFAMGLAVGVRALGGPSSILRVRMLSLAGFGLVHALYEWLTLANAADAISISAPVRFAVAGLSFLALLYFALGNRGRRNQIFWTAAVLVIAIWCAGAFLLTDPVALEVATRLMIGVPATGAAALAFTIDKAFRLDGDRSWWAPKLAAISFLAYGLLQFFSAPGSFFPATIFNTDQFQALFGISCFFARACAAIAIMVSVLALLGRFDAKMRHDAERLTKQVYQSLAASEASLNEAQRIGEMGSWVHNFGSLEMICSDHLYRIFGLEPTGRPTTLATFTERAHPDDRAFVDATVARAFQAGESFIVDHRIIRPDGTERKIRVQVQVECDSLGKPIRALGIARDTTDQEASQEKLRRAMQAALSANEAKSRFIANMSHELRTPLNAIIGFSEIMARQLFGPIGNDQYLNYAADIQKSGQHLLALINDILSISRLEVGKTDLNDDADIDLQTLIENCLRWVSGRALEAGVELESTVAPETPGLRADSRLLTQVLLNLLSNAVKFTPRGGKVQLDVGVADNGGIEIAVRDTGIGMSPDEVANIGVPFLQFDNGLARKFEGTGLGLSIAKRLIELHGGRLEVQSVPNKGTEMRVLLPPERTVWREGVIARKSAALSMQAT